MWAVLNAFCVEFCTIFLSVIEHGKFALISPLQSRGHYLPSGTSGGGAHSSCVADVVTRSQLRGYRRSGDGQVFRRPTGSIALANVLVALGSCGRAGRRWNVAVSGPGDGRHRCAAAWSEPGIARLPHGCSAFGALLHARGDRAG